MALALVYMVLASQFKSLVDPLVIMFSVPLGITGVFLMLYLTKTTISVNSVMGIIMMVGIVVSNGVLLVDFANVLRGRGMELTEATIVAGKTRLRPILMTTLATVVGLIPMALGIGEGSETNLPLARAVSAAAISRCSATTVRYARAADCATWRRTSAALVSAMRRVLSACRVSAQARAATIGTVSCALAVS